MAGPILEPNLTPEAASANITLEDYLDQLDRIEPAQTPMTTFCANEIKLKSSERSWNVDSYPTPNGATGRADGEQVNTATMYSWNTNMRKMGNLMQGFARPLGVGWQAQEVPHIAGVTNILSYAKASAMESLKVDMECAFCSLDQPAVIDQGPGLGGIMAGYRKMVDYSNRYTAASAYVAGGPTDIQYAPTAACVSSNSPATGFGSFTGLTATMSRGFLKYVAYYLRVAAQKKTDWTLIAGLRLRQSITDLTEPTQVSGSATGIGIAPAQVKILSRAEQEQQLGTSIDIIVTDFGRIIVCESDYIGTTTTTSSGASLSAWSNTSGTGAGARGNAGFFNVPYAGILLKKGNVFKCWGVAPYSEELAKLGGGQNWDMKCTCMLGVRNPLLAAFWNFTSL